MNDYLYGLGREAQFKPDEFSYFYADALGSVRQVQTSKWLGSNWSFGLSQTDEYDPFGNELTVHGSPVTPYGYTGEWMDSEIGLIDLRARYYDPIVGRFFNHDPWEGSYQNPATLNPYIYVLDNPIIHIDPTGQWCVVGFSVGPGSKCTYEEQQKWANFYINSGHLWQKYLGVNQQALGFVNGFFHEYLDAISVLGASTAVRRLIDSIYDCRALESLNDQDVVVGRYYGRAFVALQTGFEIAAGISALTGGGGLDLTGVGEVIGIPVSTLGIELLGHGALVAGHVIVKGIVDPLPPIYFLNSSNNQPKKIPPTGSNVASKKPSSWREAEQILSQDLGIPKNTRHYIVPGTGRYRIPDFIGNNYIADAKWYNVSNLSSSQQLRDFIAIALQEGKPLWIYVKQNTIVSEPLIGDLLHTGGGLVRYFP